MNISGEINVNSTAAGQLAALTVSMQPSQNTVTDEMTDGNVGNMGLGTLFQDHHKGIFKVAYRITGSHSDAEDVLQTIFMRLTTGWTGRDLSPNPRAFLYRAAINASLDIVRGRIRAKAVSLDAMDADLHPSASTPGPAETLADKELKELVRHAVAKLEGRAAEAFALRYYEGYDNGQIAEILGTSQTVVAVTLHRARTRLRKEIRTYLEKHHEAQ